jgi:hypothetical protein
MAKKKSLKPATLTALVKKGEALYRAINRKGSSARGLAEAHVGTMLDQIDDLEKRVPRITGNLRRQTG